MIDIALYDLYMLTKYSIQCYILHIYVYINIPFLIESNNFKFSKENFNNRLLIPI